MKIISIKKLDGGEDQPVDQSIEQPLEEKIGVPEGSIEATTKILAEYSKVFTSSWQQFAYIMKTKQPLNTTITIVSDPDVVKVFGGRVMLMLKLIYDPNEGKKFSVGGGFSEKKSGSEIMLVVDVKYGDYSIDYMQRSKDIFVQTLLEEMESTIQHEVTHGRQFKGQPSGVDTNYFMKNLVDNEFFMEGLEIDPAVVKMLSFYFYYSSTWEIGARVSEIGARIEKEKDYIEFVGKQEMVHMIESSKEFEVYKILKNFKSHHATIIKAIDDAVNKRLDNDPELEAKINSSAGGSREKILAAMKELDEQVLKKFTKDIYDRYQRATKPRTSDPAIDKNKARLNKGRRIPTVGDVNENKDSQIIEKIFRANTVEVFLNGLTKYFTFKAEYMLKKMYKTIGLYDIESKANYKFKKDGQRTDIHARMNVNATDAGVKSKLGQEKEPSLTEAGNEQVDSETFNVEEFKKCVTFKQKEQYCNAHLPRIGAGSSRIVYQLDGNRVLKLARNSKGYEQNSFESDPEIQRFYHEIITKVISHDENDAWVESELAVKLHPSRFQTLVGLSLQEVGAYLKYEYTEENPVKGDKNLIDPELLKKCESHEFAEQLKQLMFDLGLKWGDLARISSYGLVKRDGKETVVLVDYGFTVSYKE